MKTILSRTLGTLFFAASCVGAILLAAASFYDKSPYKGVFYIVLALLAASSGVFGFVLPAGVLRKTWLIVSLIFSLLAVVLPLAAATVGYHLMFRGRSDTNAYTQSAADFPRLTCEECTFTSSVGVTLAGYWYTDASAPKKDAVVIFAHGYQSGGHGVYLSSIARFAYDGYTVFAYDATAHGKSGGNGIGGMPRGVLDLSRAIEYVKEHCPDMPILLCGHSWGGYSVLNVLNKHPEVGGVVSMSGFDRSVDLIEAHVPAAFKALKQYLIAAEFLTFGKTAFESAVTGIKKSAAHIMIVHSSDDPAVPPSYSVSHYKDAFGDDDRITYKLYENRGHSPFVGGEAVKGAPVGGIDENLYREILAFYDDRIDQ